MKTPTLDKMLAVKGESQIIGDFLTWLAENECEIASYDPVALRGPAAKLAEALRHDRRPGRALLIPVNLRLEQLLALYFDIDLAVAEREREKLLTELSRQRDCKPNVNRGDNR